MTDEEKIVSAVSVLARAIGEQKAEVADVAGAALYLVERTAVNVGRIADALTRIADAAEKKPPETRNFIGMPSER